MATLFGFKLASRDDPLANVRSVRAWCAQLPRNDPVGAVEAIGALLAASGSVPQEISSGRTQALLDLDRISIPLQTQVREQYRMSAMSDDVRQRLWRACDEAARWFAHAYEEIAAGARERGARPRGGAAMPGVFARLFHYVGMQSRQGLFRYEKWIPGKWRQLHDAYRDACEQGVVAEPYTPDPAQPAAQLSAEQEYVQILLLQLLNTGNLTAQQIDWAAEWLHDWAPRLSLAMTPLEGDGYWLDLGRGEGLLSRKPEQPAGDLLFLAIGPLRVELAALHDRLAARHSEGSAHPDTDDRLALLRQLDRLWLPQAPEQPRRGERRAVEYAATVAIGWPAITAALATKFVRRTGAPTGYHYDDYGRLQPDKVAARKLAEPRRADPDGWLVSDSSDSGFRIRSSSQQAGRLRPGALFALQLQDHPRWQVGIVRRIKRLGSGQTELGVEIITRNATLIMPREVDGSQTGYTVDGVDIGTKFKSFHALHLPSLPQARNSNGSSLLLPPAEFTRGRMLSMVVDGQHQELCLGAPLERSKEWVWSAVDPAH